MLINLFDFIIHNFMFFTGAYSNNAFPEPLSKEEEEEYINKMMMGDKNARSKLIEHNLRLVAHIVKKFESNTNDIDDLIGIGTVLLRVLIVFLRIRMLGLLLILLNVPKMRF